MSSEQIRRHTLPVEARVLDAKAGIAEYIASDETPDSYREVIRVDGWRFNRFAKNAPFLDSHCSGSVEDVLGKVVDYRVVGRQLIETVQWAIDVPSNTKARIGWDMTAAGYLRAVSVGFVPIRMVSKWDSDQAAFQNELGKLGAKPGVEIRAIYLEQEQLELSAVAIGANPAALLQVARAYKAGAIDEAAIEFLAADTTRQRTEPSAPDAQKPGPASAEAIARHLRRQRFLDEFQGIVRSL